MIYCVDTSGWLDGWVRDYPPDVFPTLWQKLSECIEAGTVKCSEEVFVELAKKEDDLHQWIKVRKDALVVRIDDTIQNHVVALLEEYPRLVDTQRQRSQADPFVIATAMALGSSTVVVTGEKPGGGKSPKIPDVCAAKAIQCIPFLEMLRLLGWKF